MESILYTIERIMIMSIKLNFSKLISLELNPSSRWEGVVLRVEMVLKPPTGLNRSSGNDYFHNPAASISLVGS